MSRTHPTPVSSPNPNFQLILNNALKAYEKRTKLNLLSHPLSAQLDACESPSAIIAVIHQQLQRDQQSQEADEKLTKWLNPTINVLYTFSATLGEGVGLVFSPANVIFAGIGFLLSAAIDVRTSHKTLIGIFKRMENFFKRLEVYSGVSPTPEMIQIIVDIMVEVLSILATATKEIKQGFMKKFLKKLVGRTDIEDAQKNLDRLIDEETRMAAAQILNVTEQVKQSQLQEDFRRWLSPPDPSTNHNIACGAHHKRTAEWFLKSSIFTEWKSTASLLWLHGKLGSGKSILCSTIIQDITALSDSGSASMAYFYFDFRDAKKQNRRNLLPSLVTQLSTQSDECFKKVEYLYLAHSSGAKKPSEDALIQCLKDMLTVLDQHPVYIIIDALDECPNTSGMPSPREQVLDLLKELVELSLPNLHLCVTSRPEIDIRRSLEPLTSRHVSLHEQSGQMNDIIGYITSVVQSDPRMRRWRHEDKDLVIQTLSERADGMFRWVFCQLEALRYCFPPSVRHMLEELPETLDETYERVLRDINKANRGHAIRLLQCLTVAIRPLHVTELAEVLAVDFGTSACGGTSKLNTDWRWEDQEHAILSTCSSLVSIVDKHGLQVVQFSHFSVKEFLTSSRFAGSSADLSPFHILLEPAHTTLAMACLGVILQLDKSVNRQDVDNSFPLARYAAKHWVDHAKFEQVSSHLQEGMEDLFDQVKPHFAAWLRTHDIDSYARKSPLSTFGVRKKLAAAPLYYAALCGFYDLAKHLIIKHTQEVNANGGYYVTPLGAALVMGHLNVAQLLCEHGADIDVRGDDGSTPLYIASSQGHRESVEWLLSLGADPNLYDPRNRLTPLHTAAWYGQVEVCRVLLQHKSDPNALDKNTRTPLHLATERGHINVARLLLEHGVDVNAQDVSRCTALHLASGNGKVDIAILLLEHGVDLDAKDHFGRTAFQVASGGGHHDIANLLSK